ncbi:glycoside hydrolase family 43 protein [Saccharophagus degradans]|uniref:Glycoside hydrolase family 43 protein n=1 Tax=Saccharophagus degradans TaxID=86304 RepID=A0AAW7X9T6_9GAMM|nr:glycoside hydrolase family 43 protein [Saccharophagus degradans]MDO6423139.1 glycoside hydrolase family 43 protein [Saccharophagus degradans]MDO6607337.1 glycoside hydrolase family 43 protein [Saccharophagus degradans]
MSTFIMDKSQLQSGFAFKTSGFNVLIVVTFLALLTALVGCSSAKLTPVAYPSLPQPLVAQRADPWVHKHSDGYYYFIATVPAYDRLEMRRATTIAGLHSAPAVVVWQRNTIGGMSANIWAPELHFIDGKWYIYVAAATDHTKPWTIRMHTLSNASANPMQGEWQEEGRFHTPLDTFSLDATTFEHRGKRYLVWAQQNEARTYNSALLIAQMDSPTSITGPIVTLSEPTLPWEIIGHKVNEGAAVIKHGKRIFISYSASATDHNYAMGLLWADENADLLDATNWTKSPEPVFYSNEQLKRFGPGHNCFVKAEDGVTDLMVYHARDYKEIDGEPLRDPNRHTRVRKVYWDEQGMPDFRQHEADL